MEILVLLPSLLVFLYSLYKLSGDDHVFIRKNISPEQLFDIAFTTFWISLIISRISYFILEKGLQSNLFLLFFTTAGGFSFIGAVVGSMIAIYLISKYKKVPMGRIYDFFTLSLLTAFPVGFVSIAILYWMKPLMIPFLINAALYLILAVVFRKFFYPKLLNRSMKEGTISALFFLLFPIISFATYYYVHKTTLKTIVNPENIIYLSIFVIGFILLAKLERGKLRRRSKNV